MAQECQEVNATQIIEESFRCTNPKCGKVCSAKEHSTVINQGRWLARWCPACTNYEIIRLAACS